MSSINEKVDYFNLQYSKNLNRFLTHGEAEQESSLSRGDEYTPLQMLAVTATVAESTPICKALDIALRDLSGKNGVKLTSSGKWPKKLSDKINALIDDVDLNNTNLHCEGYEYSLPVTLQKLLLDAGMSRINAGYMNLTDKGCRLLEAGSVKRFNWISQKLTEGFSSERSISKETQLLRQHWAFMILFLLKNGQGEQSISFYVDEYRRAMPKALDICPRCFSNVYKSDDFTNNVFAMVSCWLQWLGWVDVRYDEKYLFGSDIFIKATPEFYARWHIENMDSFMSEFAQSLSDLYPPLQIWKEEPAIKNGIIMEYKFQEIKFEKI